MIKNIRFKAFIQVYLMKSFPNRHDIVYLGIGNEDGQMLLYTQLPENRRTYDFCNRTFQQEFHRLLQLLSQHLWRCDC